jgi:hypothetical protein
MVTLLAIIVVAVAAVLLLAHPEAPQPSIIYVPLIVEEPQSGGLGWPLLIIGAIVLFILLGQGV